MKKHVMKPIILIILISAMICTTININAQTGELSYNQLRKDFESPDFSYWEEVPLWRWDGDKMDKERITFQLEELSIKGIKAVCPIQRSPVRSYPESFSDEWWKTLSYVHEECERLGMRLWIYDQLGYGQYGWFEKAVAQIEDTGTSQINFESFDLAADKGLQLQIPPEGKFLEARAYQMIDGIASDEESIDIAKKIKR